MIEPPRLDDEAFSNLTTYIQGLLEQMETLPFPNVQEDVFALLNSLDHLHREAFTRLVALIDSQAPELKLPMANDFAIQTLMMLYNFVPADELPAAASPQTNSTLISIDQIMVAEADHPIWVPADQLENIPVGEMRAYRLEGKRVVICRPEGDELFALENACLDSILPLDRGQLDAYILHCPWHSCQYDVRTGEIQNGSKLKLQRYPTQVTPNGRAQVGFNIPEWMR